MILSADGIDGDLPVIGYHNVVTIGNVSATSAATGFPGSNVANPAVNLRWEASPSSPPIDQVFQVSPGAVEIDYIAVAEHNFFSADIAVLAVAYGYGDAYDRILMHFDIGLTDEAGNTWTANGNAAVTQLYSKFGNGSLALDGTGDWIDTPGSANFVLGSGDWTFELWFNANDAGGTTMYLAGQGDNAGTVTTQSFFIGKDASNQIFGIVSIGAAQTSVTGTSIFTATTNPGWHHARLVRYGIVLKLFVDGVQEGGDVALVGSVNDASSYKFTIGRPGEIPNNYWNGWIDDVRLSVGIARSIANFTPPTAPHNAQVVQSIAAPDSYTKALLYFQGADGSTVFRDETGKTWTTNGNTYIDGQSGAYFDGTGDYIDTPNDSRYALGSGDWTVEAIFKVNQTNNLSYQWIAGQDNAANDTTAISFLLGISPGSKLVGFVAVGGTLYSIVGTTVLSLTENVGEHHVALTRTGGFLHLWLDGVEDATPTAIAGSVNTSTNKLTIGRPGELVASLWVGWIKYFRLSVGIARYTASFTPPTTTSRVPPDDGPLIFRFDPIVANRVQLVMKASTTAPRIGVLYVGSLLEVERGVAIDVKHTPINMGRNTQIATGRSESGKFIGRIVLGSWRESMTDFKWFTPDWYRTYFEPFLAQSAEYPFFYAWAPSEYPLEVGFVAMTDDPKPEVDPVTRRVAVQIKYQGDAA